LGRFALVDENRAEDVQRWWWTRTPHGYVARFDFRLSLTIWLHRYLVDAQPQELVDHVNRNKLDNRLENLRCGTPTNNLANAGLSPRNTSGFKGVSPVRGGRWRASISVQNRGVNLGQFATAEEAAHVYDEAARQLHGVWARLNFPRDGERGAFEG
jgi:hypothetical protein